MKIGLPIKDLQRVFTEAFTTSLSINQGKLEAAKNGESPEIALVLKNFKIKSENLSKDDLVNVLSLLCAARDAISETIAVNNALIERQLAVYLNN